MSLPTREVAQKLLEKHVKDEYQRYHALMVATAMDGYADKFGLTAETSSAQTGENKDLWYITGLLHDLDFEEHPDEHPAKALEWFKELGYPKDLIHAVEAHAYGYNNFATLPQGKLASALMACDEISGIFYAYQKINPLPYREMKVKSIKKRLKEKDFAKKIDRDVINRGVEALGVELDEHITNLIQFFSVLS